MKTQLIPISQLDAPSEWHRKPSKVDDDALRRSIEEGEAQKPGAGIQQPLVVLPNGGKRFLVVDGIRRMKVAGLLGVDKVRVVVDEPPAGEDPKAYARRLRFLLDELRQDLRPSQRAELIEKLKSQFGMSNLDVSQYLGVDQDSITNWLAIRRYIPEVVEAMDRGLLTQQAARVFDGMSERGQKRIWKTHADDLMGGALRHRELRAMYGPTEHPDYYRDPEKIQRRLTKKGPGKRAKVARPSFTPAEKRRLSTSFEMKEIELRTAKDELQQYGREINASIPLVAAITRNERLWAMVPDEMRDELSRFAEVYV
jgi:ParB/RepB/Spo0J family partition protein